MSTTTTNYGLIKPDTTDPILIGQLNDNADIIDATMKSISDALDVAKLGIKYKGEVYYYSDLPSTGNQIGDAYTVKYSGTSGTTPDGTEYVWGTVSGTNQWIDFSKDSYTKAEVDALLALKQNALNSAQLAAVNSGIDSEKVAQYDSTTELEAKDRAALVELVDSGAKNIADFTSTTKTIYTTATSHGITITRNGDIFTISGTSDTNENVFFNIYYSGSPSTKMIPPGNWVALIEDYTGSIVKDIAVQPCTPTASPKVYGIPVQFSLSGSEEGNWLRVNLRPSTTYDGSFRLMICTKAAWDISHKYQPYRPSYHELYEMVKALQVNQ